MPLFKDYTGRTFGRLKVLRRADNVGSFVAYECLCACGEKAIVTGNRLQQGVTKSCGCFRKEGRPNLRLRKRPYEHLYNGLRSVARRRRIEVHLTFEEFLEFTKINSCHYCLNDIQWSAYASKHNSRTNLDRKDNLLPYQRENLVVCCPACNAGKSNLFSYEEWVVMTMALRQFRGKR